MDDLREIPDEWFIEIDGPPLNYDEIEFVPYESNCPELLGNMVLALCIDDVEGQYFMEQKILEPIGDYGSHWITRWHKCIENKKLAELIKEPTDE